MIGTNLTDRDGELFEFYLKPKVKNLNIIKYYYVQTELRHIGDVLVSYFWNMVEC